jgi:hypothetical protein
MIEWETCLLNVLYFDRSSHSVYTICFTSLLSYGCEVYHKDPSLGQILGNYPTTSVYHSEVPIRSWCRSCEQPDSLLVHHWEVLQQHHLFLRCSCNSTSVKISGAEQPRQDHKPNDRPIVTHHGKGSTLKLELRNMGCHSRRQGRERKF